ncbi:MAG: tetratricopeptide repeat protein [Planctomycetota bacterium]
MASAPDASSDDSVSDDPRKGPGPAPELSGTPVKKSAFSDDFDNPDRRDYEDELPEDEPLTPELVEEEAIRGDFMLRWAVVCLAALMAFTCISDTKPLVLIRSGALMLKSGFLPPRTDPLSLTMEGRNVSNAGWLFDHLVSVCWSVGGPYGLTSLKVFIAVLSTWLLTRISIPGLPTWFSSICAALAVVACAQDYIPAHELISIAGMTLTMRLLTGHRLGTARGLDWKLPLLVAIWCNFDPRAWVGAFVIVAYATGTAVQRRGLIRSGASQERLPASLLATAGLSVAALLANPFPTASIFSPLSLYTREYPAMREQKDLVARSAATLDDRLDFYCLVNPDAIALYDHTHIAGVSLLLLAVVILCISLGSDLPEPVRGSVFVTFLRGLLRLPLLPVAIISGRPVRDAGYLFAVLGMLLLCLLAMHELPAAAIVAATAAGVTAQDWYRRTFSMTYTVESSELLFSRGGRAATVLALAVLAFAVVTSRLPGAAPLGFGFDPETQVTVDTLSSQIQSLDPEARVLHTRLEQGDLLIWNGRKSFVDSRVLPFSSAANPIFRYHGDVRRSLLRPPPEAPKTSDPKEKDRILAEQQKSLAAARKLLEDYRITHIMVRLAPPGNPDYQSINTLVAGGEFLPISIEPSAAVMQKFPPQTTPEQLAEKLPNFVDRAFRSAQPAPLTLRSLTPSRSFYDRWIYRTRPYMTAARRQAMHYLELAESQPQNIPKALNSIALLTLGIRQLNVALDDDHAPDDVGAWLSLGYAYQQLSEIEQLVGGPNASPRLRQLRSIQAVSAYRQAVRLEPKELRGWEGLLAMYERMQRRDLMLEVLEKWLEIVETLDVPDEVRDQFEEYRTQRFAQKRDLEDLLLESDAELDRQIDQQKQANAEALLEARKQAKKDTDEAAALDEVNAEEARETLMSAALANSAGRPRRALNGLEEKAALLEGVPPAQVLKGMLLLELGELEAAHQLLLRVNQLAMKEPQQFAGTNWQLPVAISQLCMGDYPLAAETLNNELTFVDREANRPGNWSTALFSLPLVGDVNLQFNGQLPVWPFVHTAGMGQQISTLNELRAESAFLQAIVRLEEGDVPRAKAQLFRVVTEYGETRVRQLAALYHTMSDADSPKTLENYSLNPWEEFDYPGEPVPPAPVAPQGAEAVGAPAGSGK